MPARSDPSRPSAPPPLPPGRSRDPGSPRACSGRLPFPRRPTGRCPAGRQWPRFRLRPSPLPPCSAAATGRPRAPQPIPVATHSATHLPATAGPGAGPRVRQQVVHGGGSVGVATPRRADFPGYRSHLPAQLFQLLSAVELRLIGGESSRHHHTPAVRVLLMLFECMFDRFSQHPPTDNVNRIGRAPFPPANSRNQAGDVDEQADQIESTGKLFPIARLAPSPHRGREVPPPRAASRRASSSGYSHSMVPGGLLVTSSTTRLTSATSLVIRVEIRSSTS